MPRKLASRMKFEKYASSRTYAGIHRISAVSRNRTRNEETNRAIAIDASDDQRGDGRQQRIRVDRLSQVQLKAGRQSALLVELVAARSEKGLQAYAAARTWLGQGV
jgi:hypothetical protein